MATTWIDRIERRLSFIAVPGLAAFLAGMNAIVGLLALSKPEFPALLTLDPVLIMSGQPWRTLTFLFVPPAMSPLWLLLWLAVSYMYMNALEKIWGDFKFTLYCLTGAAALVAAAFYLHQDLPGSSIQNSLFLAFAHLNPEFEVYLFLILPIKMKWLARFAWATTLLGILFGGHALRVTLMAGLVNYALFFAPEHWNTLILKIHHWRRGGRFGQ